MFNLTPSTQKGHFRNYPVTGHIVDMARTTRMTPTRTCCKPAMVAAVY